MLAAILAAVLLQSNTGPTFSEGPPDAPVDVKPAVLHAVAPTNGSNGQLVSPVQVTAVESGDDNVKVCQYAQDTGSLFSHRVCHTKADWRTLNAEARDMLNESQARGATAAFSAGGH